MLRVITENYTTGSYYKTVLELEKEATALARLHNKMSVGVRKNMLRAYDRDKVIFDNLYRQLFGTTKTIIPDVRPPLAVPTEQVQLFMAKAIDLFGTSASYLREMEKSLGLYATTARQTTRLTATRIGFERFKQ